MVSRSRRYKLGLEKKKQTTATVQTYHLEIPGLCKWQEPSLLDEIFSCMKQTSSGRSDWDAVLSTKSSSKATTNHTIHTCLWLTYIHSSTRHLRDTNTYIDPTIISFPLKEVHPSAPPTLHASTPTLRPNQLSWRMERESSMLQIRHHENEDIENHKDMGYTCKYKQVENSIHVCRRRKSRRNEVQYGECSGHLVH